MSAYPNSPIAAPTADIVVGGIEVGIGVAAGVGGAVLTGAGPEFWPISIPLLNAAPISAIDGISRIKKAIDALEDNNCP